MKKFTRIFVFSLIAIIIYACTNTSVQQPSSVAVTQETPGNTSLSSAIPSIEPSATPKPEPTATPAPTSSPTPSPSPSPSPSPTPQYPELKDLGFVGTGFYSISANELKKTVSRFSGLKEFYGRLSGGTFLYNAGYAISEQLEAAGFSPLPCKCLDYYAQSFNLVISGIKYRNGGQNIIGFLEGSTKKDEFVVITAHYDGASKGNRISPAADDNASGVAAALEIAQAFGLLAKQGILPERSIIIVFFDAGKVGMQGAKYFAKHPPVPAKKIISVINLDMLGKNAATSVNALGAPAPQEFKKHSPELWAMLKKAADIVGIKIVLPQSGKLFSASDQWPFYSSGIKPVLLLTAGTHKDHGTPNDTAKRINYTKVQNITRLAFLTLWQIANSETRPSYR